jgi:hypothetical protein
MFRKCSADWGAVAADCEVVAANHARMSQTCATKSSVPTAESIPRVNS